MFFIVCYSCFFCLLQLGASQFLVQFHKFLSIEPKIGVADVYVMSVFVCYDFYLFHIFRYLKSSCCGRMMSARFFFAAQRRRLVFLVPAFFSRSLMMQVMASCSASFSLP